MRHAVDTTHVGRDRGARRPDALAHPKREGVRLVRVAVLQHEPETGPGAFAGILERTRTRTRLFGPGEAPRDPARFDGLIVLGGSLGAHDRSLAQARRVLREAVAAGVPSLGICLGAQLLAAAVGGRVVHGDRPEVGVKDVFVTDIGRGDAVFAALPPRFSVFQLHEDSFVLPRGATLLAGSPAFRNQAFRWGATSYGLQFHLEVRAADVRRWARVPRYARQMAVSGVEADDLARQVDRVESALDRVAEVVLGRWLELVRRAAASRMRPAELLR